MTMWLYLYLAATVVLFEASYATCPNSQWSYRSFTNLCYKSVVGSLSWMASRADCQVDGGDLITFPSADRLPNDILSGLEADRYYWIGLSDRKKEGFFVWNGETGNITYSNWGSHEPRVSDDKDEYNCVALIKNGEAEIKWFNLKCKDTHNYLCQRPRNEDMPDIATPGIPEDMPDIATPGTPKDMPDIATPVIPEDMPDIATPGTPIPRTTCPSSWRMFSDNQTCVKAVKDKQKWHSAQKKCTTFGGSLVTIYNKKKLDFVRGMVSKDRYWIGLQDRYRNGTFYWIDQSMPISFQTWDNPPRNLKRYEYCVELVGCKKGKWNDKVCWAKKYYICQKPADVE